MDEFDIIKRYFEPLTQGADEALSLHDDAAVLAVPEGYELVVTTDILNEGVHFPDGEDPGLIARKALRVNLSDLAAMGAKPYCYQLGLGLSEICDEAWLEAFTAGLEQDQEAFDIFLSGGDTTRINGPLSVSVTAFGLVSKGEAVKRSGAKSGDVIVLTGVIGDSYCGLQCVLGRLEAGVSDVNFLIERYRLPRPRLGVLKDVLKYVHAAADISDGLVADLGHVCNASGMGAVIDLSELTFSKPVHSLLERGDVCVQDLLSGGDDYELVLAVPFAQLNNLLKSLEDEGLAPQCIGRFMIESPGVVVKDDDGQIVKFARRGWMHF